MWGWIEKIVQGLVTGIVGPVFTYLGKKQDDTLAGFSKGAEVDAASYQAWLTYQVQIGAQKAAANGWWGAKVLYLIVGFAAAAHTAAVFLDSTVRFGCGHYGCLGVPPLPGAYADYERVVVYSLFVVSTVGPPVSAVSAWLHRK